MFHFFPLYFFGFLILLIIILVQRSKIASLLQSINLIETSILTLQNIVKSQSKRLSELELHINSAEGKTKDGTQNTTNEQFSEKPVRDINESETSEHIIVNEEVVEPTEDIVLENVIRKDESERIEDELKEEKTVEQPIKEFIKDNPILESTIVKSKSREEWEQFIGGKVLNRIGALAIILGVVFFLKYAFDNNLIPESVRVLMGGIFGLTCLGFAHKMKEKGYEVFAQGIVGTGIAVLYMSVYASFNFYHLVPQIIAFVLMSIVTAIGLWQAIKYKAFVIAVLSWLGGFGTPFMLSTGEANPIGLFTYIALLVVGILGILYVLDEWILLELPTRFATYGIFALWFFKDYSAEKNFAVSLFFATFFWLLFYGYEFLRLKNRKRPGNIIHQGGSTMNAMSYYSLLYTIIESKYPDFTAPIILLYGLAYVLLYKIATNRNDDAKQILRERYALTTAFTLFFATNIAFNDFNTVSLWSIEALLILLLAKKINVKVLEWFGFGMYVASTFVLLTTYGSFSYHPIADFTLILNERFLAYFVLSSFALACVFIDRKKSLFNLKYFSLILQCLWVVIGVFCIISEIDNTFDFFGLHLDRDINNISYEYYDLNYIGDLIQWFGGIAFLLMASLFASKKSYLLTSYTVAFCLLPIVLLLLEDGFNYSAVSSYTFLFNWRIGILSLSALFLFGILRNVKEIGVVLYFDNRIFYSMVTILIVANIMILVHGEVDSFFAKEILVLDVNHSIADISYSLKMKTLLFSRKSNFIIWWSIALMIVAMTGHKFRNFATYIAVTLLIIINTFKIFFDLWQYSPIQNFTLILNIRFLSVSVYILSLIGTLFFVRKFINEKNEFDTMLSRFYAALGALLFFILLNIEAVDYFEMLKYPYWINTNMFADSDIIIQQLSNKQQLAISIVWICYAAFMLWLGILKRKFVIRVIAMLLVGASILKVFLFDLSYLQTLYRIFSFIGLGFVLMLLSFLYYRFKDVLLGTSNHDNSANEMPETKENPVPSNE